MKLLMKTVRKASVRLSALCLMLGLLFPLEAGAAGTAGIGAKAGLDIQLIADQKKVGAGGTVSYHLIYHNVENETQSNTIIKLIVPGGLDAGELGGAEWDATARVLQWNIKEIPAGGAGVIHFNLKVKADVMAGTPLEVTGTAVADGGISIALPKVSVVAGTQVDQPFFNGYPDGKFHPERNLTRAETAAVVARIQNLKANDQPVSYSDVDSTHWAHRYIAEVTQAGYMNGDGGKFRPDEPITRAELVTLVLRMRGVHAVPLGAFDDLQGHWANEIVGTAKALRFIEGLTDGKFEPDQYIRRDAAAKLIDIGLSRGPLDDGDIQVIQHFPDVDRQHWAFGWVEEASMVAHESVVKSLGSEQLIRYLPDQTEPF